MPKFRSILVVDDHNDGRDSLCLALKLSGYLPVPAKNGGEAVQHLERGLRPCVVLLDLIMPGDGWHFRAKQIANPEWRDIPVIVGTGLGKRPETVAPELEVAPENYLLKPFDFDALFEKINALCGANPAAE